MKVEFMFKTETVKALVNHSFKGTYIGLINPEKIPHLIVISQGKYFSLTNKKSVISESFLPYFEKLKRTYKQVLFVELSVIEQHSFEIAFKAFNRVNNSEITCLAPIKLAIDNNSSAQFIFEFLSELKDKKRIQNYFHINLNESLNDSGEFTLNTYTREDIYNYINALNKQ